MIDYDMGWATLTSLTGYKDHDYLYVEDYDALPTVTFNYGQGPIRRLPSNRNFDSAQMMTDPWDGTRVHPITKKILKLCSWANKRKMFTVSATGSTPARDMFDYYNYLDDYNGNTYYCDYYLDYYFSSCDWSGSPRWTDQRQETV